MERSDFIFYSVQLMYYKCHRVNVIRVGSYNDSPDQIKKQKSKTFEKKNLTIAVNILYIKKTKKCPAYISKINSNSTNNSVRIPNKDLER